MQTILKLNLLLFQIEFNITRFVIELKFFLTFNLFLIPIVIAGYSATSYVVWAQASSDAERDILDKARVMLETARAMRTYTTNQIAPLLERKQSEVDRTDKSLDQILNVHFPDAMSKAIAQVPTAREQQALQSAAQRILSNVRQERQDAPVKEFLPQSIPFFAATEAFNYFRQQYPDFSYKEAALNPTNPRDRTSDWEMDVVNLFHNDAKKKEFSGRRDTPSGPMLYVSTPIRVDDKSCLVCHGVPGDAPAELVRRYGANNGFGWALDDVIGAQIVSIPAKVAGDRALTAQRAIMLWFAGVFASVWALVNLLVYVFYKRNAFAARLASPAGAGG